jgi:hypothetical protein
MDNFAEFRRRIPLIHSAGFFKKLLGFEGMSVVQISIRRMV